MDMMIIASLLILCLVMILTYGRVKRKQKKDSALRQKAVFSSSEQLMFSRLKAILPHTQILAHVSFDTLLTTKYLHTRRKYQRLVADFVMLDQDYRVIAVIALDDLHLIRRSKMAAYQDALLETAGYRVVRYVGVPSEEQLRHDFVYHLSLTPNAEHDAADLLQDTHHYAKRMQRIRAFG